MSTLKNKRKIQLESDIEKARFEKDWINLQGLIKKYNKSNTDNSPIELLIAAEKYLSEFDFNNALITLNKAYGISPDNQEVLAYLGIVEYEKNDIVKALGYLTKCINPFAVSTNTSNNNNDALLMNPTQRRVGLLIQAFTIKGKCYENQGNTQSALTSYQNVIEITFKYFKNLKSIDKQTKLFIEDSLIRYAIIQKYFGNIQMSIKHLRSCLSSQIGLSKDTFRISLMTLSHLLLRNVCSASYVPTNLESSSDTSSNTSTVGGNNSTSGVGGIRQFYIPNDETEESILSLLYAEIVLSQQQLQLQQQTQLLTTTTSMMTPSAIQPSSSNTTATSSPQTPITDSNGNLATTSSPISITSTTTTIEATTNNSHLNHHLSGHNHNFIEEQDPTIIYEDICLAYSRKEQYYPIVEQYEKSLVLNFSDPHKWVQLALSLYSAGKYKRSLFIIEECLSKTPKNITLLLLASKICINHLNQITKALLFSKQAISYIDPVEDSNTLGRAYLLMGIAYGKKSIECKSSHEKNQNIELAQNYLKQSYELDPYDYRNSYHLALIYADQRDTPMALKYIHESLTLNPYEPSLWSCLALLLSSNKNYELSYRTCNHALTQSPTNVELLLIKAKLELALDDGTQALITYKTIFSHLVAKTLTSNEDFDDSISLPRNRNQSAGPSSVVSFDLRSGTTAGDSRSSHRGSSYSINNAEMDSAMRDFEDSPTSPKDLLRTTTTSSNHSGTNGYSNSGGSGNNGYSYLSGKEQHRNIALWLSLAEAFTQQRMFKDAAQCLTQAELIDSDSADVYYYQGYLLETQDLTQRAILNYHKALSLDSTHTNSSIRLALHYFRENDLLLAENNLTTILRSSDPASHQAWFQLGLVLKAKGEIERSSDCFKKAIELDSTSPLIPYSQISRFVF